MLDILPRVIYRLNVTCSRFAHITTGLVVLTNELSVEGNLLDIIVVNVIVSHESIVFLREHRRTMKNETNMFDCTYHLGTVIG
jgi:hypothetical protein